MLREIQDVRQNPGEPRRRWFSDNDLDLYVWLGEDGGIVQFQLCYDKGRDEQALTWRPDTGLTRHAVDDGEGGIYRMKSTPVLTGAELPETVNVRRTFIDAGQKLEHDLYQFILDRLP